MASEERNIVKYREVALTGLELLEEALASAGRLEDAGAVNLMTTQLPVVAAVEGEGGWK